MEEKVRADEVEVGDFVVKAGKQLEVTAIDHYGSLLLFHIRGGQDMLDFDPDSEVVVVRAT